METMVVTVQETLDRRKEILSIALILACTVCHLQISRPFPRASDRTIDWEVVGHLDKPHDRKWRMDIDHTQSSETMIFSTSRR